MGGVLGTKFQAKPGIGIIKRTNPIMSKQTVTVQKAVTKIGSNLQQQKTVLMPKIQITQNIPLTSALNGAGSTAMDIDSTSLKRKRDDDTDLL